MNEFGTDKVRFIELTPSDERSGQSPVCIETPSGVVVSLDRLPSAEYLVDLVLGLGRPISRCVTFLLCVTAMLILRCDIPGCGPGELPKNPIESNLVDFTLPASQSILRLPDPDGVPPSWEFRKLAFYFLRRMNEGSFLVENDLAMCRIPEGDVTCDPGDPSLPVDVSSPLVPI